MVHFTFEKINGCLIFNPGECAGLMQGKNKIGILDLKSLNTQLLSF